MTLNKNNDTSIYKDDLWLRFKAGEFAAFEIIYRTHVQSLTHYGRKICPDGEMVKDSIHDLFVELWNSRNNLSNTDNINYYLVKSLRYKLIRKTKPVISLSTYTGGQTLTTETTPELILQQDEMEKITISQIKTVLEKLSPRQQEVIYLYFFCGYSLSQVADTLSINYQSAANLLHRTLIALKKKLLVSNKTNLLANLASLFLFF